jgi:hypothetical protein
MGDATEAFAAKLAHRFLGVDDSEPDQAALHQTNVAAINEYFGANGLTPFDGSRFETFGLRTSHPDRITPADLVAVTMLSMEIRRSSRSGISTASALALEDRSDDISHLLRQIPREKDLHTLSSAEFDDLVASGSSLGYALWRFLRDEIGMFQVATYKLMARKRPRLFPIADSRTVDVLGRQEDWWRSWYRALTNRPEIVEELQAIRVEAAKNVPAVRGVSLLRIADIALWNSSPRVEDEPG